MGIRRVGPYELTSLLGKGGMGEVYLARDSRNCREVALKILDSRRTDEPEHNLERFRREGEILRGINHPGLPDIYEVGATIEGEAFLAMEYLQGRRLTAFIGGEPLETIPLLIQICSALRAIAGQGVVHRDLSPDNVIVVERDDHLAAKVIDFGIAKEVARTTQLTSAGFFVGKLQYCSPEHVGLLPENEALDWRSDLYSFGVVAYQVLSGSLPFRSATAVGYLGAQLYEKPRSITPPGRGAPYPRKLIGLFERILEKDRRLRPSSYDDVIRCLSLSHAGILLRRSLESEAQELRARRRTTGK